MSDLILYKDSPMVLEDFGSNLTRSLKRNITAGRRRYRWRGSNPNGYSLSKLVSRQSSSKSYNNTGNLKHSIDYTVAGLKLFIRFNEYGVLLDRGTEGMNKNQRDNESVLRDADIDSKSLGRQNPIEKWIQKRGLRPRARNAFGMFLKLKNTKSNRNKMNFLIQRSLLNRGINATFWFTRPYMAIKDKMPDNLIFGMHKTLDDAFDTIFKK